MILEHTRVRTDGELISALSQAVQALGSGDMSTEHWDNGFRASAELQRRGYSLEDLDDLLLK